MKVSDLQQLLVNLGPLLKTCGVKEAALADLKQVNDGLAPFGQLLLKDFAGFLARAEVYKHNGEVPIKPPPAPRGGRPGTKKVGKVAVDVNAVAQQVRALYERAAAPSTTDEVIAAETAQLGQLTKNGLVVVAEAIELMGMKAKNKDEIAAGIRQRIRARKGTTQRVGLIDRPASSTAAPSVDASGQHADLQAPATRE